MPVTHKNRLRTTISNTPGAAGALTISTASSGYRTFAAGDDGLTFDVVITDGTAWEVRTDCTYTHSGTSLSRGTLEDSSTGSAITLTSAAVVTVTATAAWGNSVQKAAPNVNQVLASTQRFIASGHLTMNNASSTGAATVANKIYFAPYLLRTAASIDGMAARVGTGVAATSFRLGLYECGTDGHPGALLRETSNLSAATSGTDVVGSITSIRLQPGWYFVAIATEGAPAMGRADGDGNTAHILGQSSSNLLTANEGFRADHTFGALPNPAPTTSLLNITGFTLTTIFLRPVP